MTGEDLRKHTGEQVAAFWTGLDRQVAEKFSLTDLPINTIAGMLNDTSIPTFEFGNDKFYCQGRLELPGFKEPFRRLELKVGGRYLSGVNLKSESSARISADGTIDYLPFFSDQDYFAGRGRERYIFYGFDWNPADDGTIPNRIPLMITAYGPGWYETTTVHYGRPSLDGVVSMLDQEVRVGFTGKTVNLRKVDSLHESNGKFTLQPDGGLNISIQPTDRRGVAMSASFPGQINLPDLLSRHVAYLKEQLTNAGL